jgi:quinol-cytochrome oxidoreductase complex cytochrome b subunit
MSFWGATVITNLCSTIPVVGVDIVYLLWGGFSIGNATLTRFYALHYLMPFVIVGLVGLHLVFLHRHGSNNPLGIVSTTDEVAFTPYYTIKDLYSIFLFIIFFSTFVYFMPNELGHPDNYIKANAMKTPPHIVPEWYFLLYYAILRSIPSKLGGVVAMVLSIFILAFIAFYVDTEVRSGEFRPLYGVLFWFFVFICLILGWIGGKTIKTPYYEIGQCMGCLYFIYLCFILPGLKLLEESLCHRI